MKGPSLRLPRVRVLVERAMQYSSEVQQRGHTPSDGTGHHQPFDQRPGMLI